MLKTCTYCKEEKSIFKYSKRLKNKEALRSVCKDCRREIKRKYRKTPRGKYNKTKLASKSRGLDFSLTFEQYLQFENKPCNYCGFVPDSVSLDRVDNSLGYHLDNVVSCCYMCNSMKYVFEQKDFIAQIKNIYLHQQKVKYDE
jgi:hypothetical protein